MLYFLLAALPTCVHLTLPPTASGLAPHFLRKQSTTSQTHGPVAAPALSLQGQPLLTGVAPGRALGGLSSSLHPSLIPQLPLSSQDAPLQRPPVSFSLPGWFGWFLFHSPVSPGPRSGPLLCSARFGGGVRSGALLPIGRLTALLQLQLLPWPPGPAARRLPDHWHRKLNTPLVAPPSSQ